MLSEDCDVEPVHTYKGGMSSSKFLAARRVDSALELRDCKLLLIAGLGCVQTPTHTEVNYTGMTPQRTVKRNRACVDLAWFDLWAVQETEVRWRRMDAGAAAKSQLRGRERIAAFEALWLGEEYEQAYEFVGAKLPPLWEK
jgi:hypothetical protein